MASAVFSAPDRRARRKLLVPTAAAACAAGAALASATLRSAPSCFSLLKAATNVARPPVTQATTAGPTSSADAASAWTTSAASCVGLAAAATLATKARSRGTPQGRTSGRQWGASGAANHRAVVRTPRKFFMQDEDPYEKCTAVKLQVGLQYTKSFLDTLNKLSETCDTSSDEGLHKLMLDVVLAIRRAESSWRYGSVERLVFDSDDPAREAGSALQRWGLEAQTKFGDGDEWSKMDKTAPKGVTEYIVMTLLVSCYGPICGNQDKLVVRSASDMRAILESVGGIQVDELIQLDVQWIPEEDGDSFGAMEVTMKFPELASI